MNAERWHAISRSTTKKGRVAETCVRPGATSASADLEPTKHNTRETIEPKTFDQRADDDDDDGGLTSETCNSL